MSYECFLFSSEASGLPSLVFILGLLIIYGVSEINFLNTWSEHKYIEIGDVLLEWSSYSTNSFLIF